MVTMLLTILVQLSAITGRALRIGAVSMLFLVVAACGGGGGGDDLEDALNGSGLAGITSTVTISGQLNLNATAEQDSDFQQTGQSSNVTTNNEFVTAQRLNNPTSVGGYVSADASNYSNGVSYGADAVDVFSLPLLEGQTLSFTLQNAKTTPARNLSVLVQVFKAGNTSIPIYSRFASKPILMEFVIEDDDEYFIKLTAQGGGRSPALYQIESSQTLVSGAQLAQGSYAELASARVSVMQQDGTVVQHKSSASDNDLGKLQALRAAQVLATESRNLKAEPDYLVKSTSLDTNDTFADLQWNLESIDVPQAWAASTGIGARIAVIDTGTSPLHEDLQSNLLFSEGYDFISDSSNGDGDGRDSDPTEPSFGTYHGAVIAGVIAGDTNNGKGIAGAAPNARVVPIRVLDAEGLGSAIDIAEGIRYAAGLSTEEGVRLSERVDVINLSLGLSVDSFVIGDAIRDAVAEGVIVIAAAGNENNSAPFYPAYYPEVVGVGSVNHAGIRSLFSNYGDNISVMAPGGTSSSSVYYDAEDDFIYGPTGIENPPGLGDYDVFIGTSFAAPHVAAVAGLMKQLQPSLDSAMFSALINRGELSAARSSAEFYGRGIINAAMAVSAVGGQLDDELVAFPQSLSFSDSRERMILALSNLGTGDLDVVSVDFDVPWLSVTASDAGASGLGQYAISLDQSLTASNDSESASVIVTYSIDGGVDQTLVVPVFKSAQLAQNQISGVWVYLLKRDDALASSTSIQIFDSIFYEGISGSANFSFDGIPPGAYFLEASTDNDGDQRLFDPGEAVGAYRLSNSASFLDVDRSVSGLQIDIGYQNVNDNEAFSGSIDEQLDRVF